MGMPMNVAAAMRAGALPGGLGPRTGAVGLVTRRVTVTSQ